MADSKSNFWRNVGFVALFVLSLVLIVVAIYLVVKDVIILTTWDKIEAKITYSDTHIEHTGGSSTQTTDLRVSFEYKGVEYQNRPISYSIFMDKEKVNVYINPDNPQEKLYTLSDMIFMPLMLALFGYIFLRISGYQVKEMIRIRNEEKYGKIGDYGNR